MTGNWSEGTKDLTPDCFRRPSPTRKNTSVQLLMYLGGITPQYTPGKKQLICEEPSLHP